MQNLPQTFRGRERSKRGYASRLLRTRSRIIHVVLRSKVVHVPSIMASASVGARVRDSPELGPDEAIEGIRRVTESTTDTAELWF